MGTVGSACPTSSANTFSKCKMFPRNSRMKNRSMHLRTSLKTFLMPSYTSINHFVKIHEQKTIDITSLLLLLGRGAGVLCANSQRCIDSVIAFLKSGTQRKRQNAGFILSRMKNDAKFSHVPRDELFTAMDPYKLGIIEPGDDAVPLVKIVFALAAKTPYLNVVRHGLTRDYDMRSGVLVFPPIF